MLKRFLLLFLLSGAFFWGCRTDFDINAEWQDITIVYGLLDLTEDVHYIKLNRAFLGDGNALMMAQVPDSINYPYKLDVYLEEWRSGNFTGRFIIFDTLTLWNKTQGTFSSPKQLVYATDTSVVTRLNGDCIYKLFIKNPVTGKEITAQTPIVNDITITRPKPGGSAFISFINRVSADIKWKSASYGRLYQLILRFHYKEVDANNVNTFHSFDWDLGTIRANTLNGGEEIGTNYIGNQFYMTVRSNVKVNPDVKRFPLKIEMIISVAGDDLATYIDVNKPSGGIIQEKPEYTNISNGIGIFSSRMNKSSLFSLSVSSIDSLVSGQYTGHLGFNKPDPSTP